MPGNKFQSKNFMLFNIYLTKIFIKISNKMNKKNNEAFDAVWKWSVDPQKKEKTNFIAIYLTFYTNFYQCLSSNQGNIKTTYSSVNNQIDYTLLE